MYESYFNELQEVCAKRGFYLESKVKTTNGKFTLHKIVLNPNSTKKTICYSAGIHGNEISGPFAVLQFLKNYKSKKNDPRIIILPCLNPYGFLKHKYTNYNNYNLNRHYFEKPQSDEIKRIYSLVKNEKIDFFMSLHEDEVKKGFYLYKYGESDKIFRIIIDFLAMESDICRQKKIYINKAEDGIIHNAKHDGSFEEWTQHKGTPLSACLEIPDKIPLELRTQIVRKLLQHIVNSKI